MADEWRRKWARAGLARSLAVANLAIVAALLVAGAAQAAAKDGATWTLDVYDSRAVVWQDPDGSACTSAAVQTMLNLVAYESPAEYMAPPDARASRTAPQWRADTSHGMTETLLGYERANMTMLAASAGTDPHGWRNALNYYGWGSINAGVYRDSAYATFDAAARAVVTSLSRSHRPVGILARSGGHAQVVTGFVTAGRDPRVGDDFTILGVYVTDPLRLAALRDTWVSLEDWRSGATTVRFAPYLQADSPYRDGIDGAVGTAEWYGKWVIVNAVR